MYHIAICEDNEADPLILQDLLLKDSKREYSSGESLLIAMDELWFSMIFLDMQMDGMDGEETAPFRWCLLERVTHNIRKKTTQNLWGGR